MPMVWYVPPLSPVLALVEESVDPDIHPGEVFATIEELRIPIDYLASFLSAGDPEPVRVALRRMAAMRAYKRTETIDGVADAAVARAAGMEPEEMDAMFRQIAIGDYNERYVIPKAHPEIGVDPNALQGSCGLDFAAGPGPPAFSGGHQLAAEEESDFDLREYLTRVDAEGASGNGR
jgi:nitrate reductase beta subunit